MNQPAKRETGNGRKTYVWISYDSDAFTRSSEESVGEDGGKEGGKESVGTQRSRNLTARQDPLF
jgi:hypothetical protein